MPWQGFFLVAGAVLPFGFGVRTMLMAHWCFCCWLFILSQGLFSFLGPASERAGGARETGRGHSQDRWPKLAKGIFHTIWHHAEYINWGKKKEGGAFSTMAFVFPSNCYLCCSPALLGVAEPATSPFILCWCHGGGEEYFHTFTSPFPFSLLPCQRQALATLFFLSTE